MKNIKIRSLLIYIFALGFTAGIGFFIHEYITNAKTWSLNPINKHLSSGTAHAGEILDRNNLVLARTLNAERKYNSNENIRKALLHTIGDTNSTFPTSVQTIYNQELFGYNLLLGLNAPETLIPTSDIKLTLDAKICEKAYMSMIDKKGMVIVCNYLTGEIVCMVSTPTYDVLNKPDIKTISENQEFEGVYINRALSSRYTPGSVFKIITTAAALNNLSDAQTRLFKCNKTKTIDGEEIVCMQNHGSINLKNGFSKSCDIVFGDIALELGEETMTQEAEKLGFNKQLSIEGIKLSSSEYHVDENSSKAELSWSGVGQHTTLLNPMHMIIILSAIANKGVGVEPYFIESVRSSGGIFNSVKRRVCETKIIMNEAVALTIKELMRYTIVNHYGDKNFPNMKICAKTGTAEVGENKAPHGWMVGFSSEESFPYAFAVIVENSDLGIKSAGPIAISVMKEVYNQFNKKG